MKELLTKSLAELGYTLPDLPTIVVAQELPENHHFFTDETALTAANTKDNLHTSILLPVIKGI